MPARSIVLFLAVACGSLRAQVPARPPAGQSPRQADSIYALRVDPADYPGQDWVMLLDDGVVRLERDGRSTYTLRQVVQILTADGVEDWGEQSLWYTPERERARINWMRVLDRDGKILRDGPAHQQESAPQVEPGAPVYSDRRAIQATAGGLAPGTLIDYSFTREIVRPWLTGDVLYRWYLNGLSPIRRSRFTLDTPGDLEVRVVETNLRAAATDTIAGGRRIRTWAVADIPAVEDEQFAGTPNDVVAKISVAGNLSWHDVAAWYDSVLADRYVLTPEVVAALADQLRGAATLDDSLRAAYRWVAQDFRYVSLSLGDGGYVPRLPQEVYQTRFGDCKDKAVLFVSLARRLGVDAYPVLAYTDGSVDSLLPTLKQFDHVIAAVMRGGRIEYVDATSPLRPYGELPAALQHDVGLALAGDRAGLVVLPATPSDHNRYEEEVVGSLGVDGRFVGRVTVSARGTEQYELRARFADIDAQDAKARDETLRRYALSVYESAVVDSARYSDGRDLREPPSVTVWFTATTVVARAGGKYYFNLPLSSFSSARALSRLEAAGPRRFPIDVAQVNSPSVYRSAVEFHLPEGWKAHLPDAVSVAGTFGYYRAEYRQVGRTFQAVREMGGRRGLEPPDSVAALRAWMRSVAADRAAMIVLDRGTGPELVADTTAGSSPVAGALPEVMLRPADLSGETKVSNEGSALGGNDFLLSFATAVPLESYQRVFGPEQVVFTVGSSRMVALEATAAAFHTGAEASRPLDVLGLFDLRAFMDMYFRSQLGAEQASLGAVRPIPLDGIGDRASGWVLELVTPLATFETAIALAVRGRVGTAVMAVGPQGLQDGDLAGLLRRMDERVREHDGYLTDIPPDSAGDSGSSVADSALAANTDVPLNAIPYHPPDTTRTTVSQASFARRQGWPTYMVSVEGRGFTFPLGTGAAVNATMRVTLHDTDAQALKEVVATERRDRKELVGSLLDLSQFGSMREEFVGGEANTISTVTPPAFGARAFAVAARLRGMLRMDLDAIVFARGRLSAMVILTWPPGASDTSAIAAIAREMERRMRQVRSGAGETAPSAALVDAVRRVVDAEFVVDSLVDARDFDGVFRTIERAHLPRAPVGFQASTWNSVCWYGSLYGQAAKAMAACEAAVAPDTTDLSYRDSRGLARALVGDLDGSRDDFVYVVAHAAQGEFLDQRAAWLDALRAGKNPFTPEVLEALKRD
jgi:transglutaminase-like putative cysteine protease